MLGLFSLWSTLALGNPTLAVADLSNDTGQTRFDPAGPGAASMLVTKFTKVGSLQVVERAQLAAVLQELDLSASGLVDPAAAVQAGRMLGADYLAFGNVIGFEGNIITVHLRIVDTQTAAVVVAEDVVGDLGDDGSGFFELVNDLADRIVRALEIRLTPEEERSVKTLRMREIEALLQYGTGLTALEGEATDEAELCRLGSGKPVSARSTRVHDLLIDGVRDGEIDPHAFSDCVKRLEAIQTRDERDSFWTQVLRAALAEVRRDGESGTRLIDALAHRAPGTTVSAGLRKKALKAAARQKSDPGVHLIRVLEMEDGLWNGAPVTLGALVDVPDSMLAAFSLRLPDAALRSAAANLLLDRRIAASPFPIVRARADEVRAQVLERGFWAVPESFEVRGVRAPDTIGREVHVVSSPKSSSARLVVDGGSPRVPLRDLEVSVKGWPEEIGLCPPVERLDPTPCIGVERLELRDAFVDLVGGALAIHEQLTVDDVVTLGRRGDSLDVGLLVGGIRAEGLVFPVVYEAVPPMRFVGPRSGSGPDLEVELFAISGERLLVGVQAAGQKRVAAVATLADEKFVVQSVGGAGADGPWGQQGPPGRDGAPGAPGTCDTNGSNGSDGEDGGPGGPGGGGGQGGDGGLVKVVLHCDGDCSLLERFAKERVHSLAGAAGDGGPGGRGGDGGKGGEGGPGAKCEVWDDFLERNKTKTTWDGHDGQRGKMGAHGPSGPDGAPGRPGQVVVERAR